MLTAWTGTSSPHSTQLLQSPPLVCQQVVQPMERVPDYPRMQCVEGLSTPWWMKTTKVETKVGKLLFIFPAISECNIYVGTWRPDTLVAW